MKNASAKKLTVKRWLIAACCTLVSCGDTSPARYDSSFLAMGTRIDISVVDASPQRAAQLSANLEQQLLQWATDWYPWGAAPGELKRINAALAAGQAALVSVALRELLLRAQALCTASDGYFDPAVAPLVKAWGFDTAAANQSRKPPAAQQLADWSHDHPSLNDLRIDSDQVSSERRDLQIDLGAIAKGYAIERLLQQLKDRGVSGASINMGGELGIMGKLDEAARKVQVRDPRADSALGWVTLNEGESVSTSGDYERYAMIGKQRIHHLLDPHNGLPVAHTQAVTVVASDATLADAASTALMAAGPAHWQRIAKQLGVAQILRVDATGEIQITAALYARLHWNPSALATHHLTQVTL